MAPEARERPIKGSNEPGLVDLFTGKRGATPLIAAVKKPNTGKVEFVRNRVELARIRRSRTHEPAAGNRIKFRQHPPPHTRPPANAFVAERPCTRPTLRRRGEGGPHA